MLQTTVFRIVGILQGGETQNELSDSGITLAAHTVLIPHTVPPYWQGGEVAERPGVFGFFIRTGTDEPAESWARRATTLLHQPGVIHPQAQFSWVTQTRLLSSVRNLQQLLRLTADHIVFSCMILGGTTLMSLLVTNVQERIPEIGLRRSLGATPMDIGALFVAEGCAVTSAGSVAGIATSYLVLKGSAPWLLFLVRLTPATTLIVIGTALLLGFVFSYVPARQVSAIVPSEALRNS